VTDTPGRRPLPPELSPRGKPGRSKGAAVRPPARHSTTTARPVPQAGVRRFTRAVSWVATLTSTIVLLGSAGLYAYVSVLDSKITRIGAICIKDCDYARPGEANSAQNFLLVGVDSRAGANSTGSLAGLQDGRQSGERSDTTMLVHISAKRDKVTAVSFPRDLLVQVPAYRSGGGQQVGPQPAKFNAAFAYGGPKLLVKTIETNFGVRVDHYIQIDFAGFRNMVNALGGVQICLSVNAYDPGGDGSGGSGFRLSAGRHTIGGDLALQFVRQRHGLNGGDLDRVQRQQRFLASVMRKVKSAGTLGNPLRLNAFLNATVNAVKLGNTSRDDLFTLAQKMKGVGTGNVQFFTIPTSGGHSAGNIGSVLDVDAPATRRLMQAIKDDTDVNAPPKPAASPSPGKSNPASPAPVLTVALDRITVTQVQNASGRQGLGSKAAADLAALGVKVAGPAVQAPGTGGTGVTATTVRYGSGRVDSAKTIAAAIPGSTLLADPNLPASTLQVLVGSSYTGAKAVTVTPSAAASTAAIVPSTPASASPSPVPVKPNFNAATADCGP
jgi:LCP family protein required for cell wall assembly